MISARRRSFWPRKRREWLAVAVAYTVIGAAVVYSSRALESPVVPALIFFALGGAAWAAVALRLGEMTDREELERSEAALRDSDARFRAFMDHTPAVAFLKDDHGRYLYVNAGLERIFGFPSEQILGRTDDTWLPPDLAERAHQSDRQVLETGEPVQLTYEATGRNGEPRTWMTWKFRVGDGKRQIGGLAVDITDRVRAELELEVRARQLEAANNELLEADRYKDEFLSVLSHELRTPLNFITGFTSIIEDGLAGPVAPLQAQYLGQIQEGADRMLRLVQDMLDFARIRAGRLTLLREEVDVAEIVEATLGSLYPLARNQGITLSADVRAPKSVAADPGRLVQVLSNLLSNALKFTPAGGRVDLRATEQGDRLVVEVHDTGPGIPQADLEKLFRRFKQLDMTTTRTASGVGLGLAICKGIVEAHGGGIGVRSELGQGSTFWFWVPLSADVRAPETGEEAPTATERSLDA